MRSPLLLESQTLASRTLDEDLPGSRGFSRRQLLDQVPRLPSFQMTGKCHSFFPKSSVELRRFTLTRFCLNHPSRSTWLSSSRVCSRRLSLSKTYIEGTHQLMKMAKKSKLKEQETRLKLVVAKCRLKQVALLRTFVQST